MISNEVGLLGLLTFSLLASLVSGGSCLADYPSLPSSSVYSSSFTLTNQYVTGYSYNYIYFSATAGVDFTVTMIPSSVDLDLVGSKVSYAPGPTVSINQYYPGLGSTSTEIVTVYPTETECYVFGVYGWAGNSGFYSISISVSETPAPSIEEPTGAPTSQSVCKQVIGDNPSLNYIEDDFSGGYTILGGEYDYYYYSSDSYSDISIKLKEASFGTAAYVDLYVSDASINPFPTSSNYEYSSATTWSTSESVEISTSSAKCFAIAVWGETSGSYQLETQSDSEIESSNIAMILGLSIGLPVFFCCVIPISIAVCVCMSSKSPRRPVRAPVAMMNKTVAAVAGGGVVSLSVGAGARAVVADRPPAVELPPAADLPPKFEGETITAGADPEYFGDDVPPPAYQEE